jgi:hypothetical protein
MNHTYDVVAVSFPIVYTSDGDHDPNGLLYTLRCYLPLLDWARARWDDGDQLLPRLHERRQHIQLVVDGLWRYEQMRERLAAGPEQDRHLLDEFGRSDPEASSGPVSGEGCGEGCGPKSKAVRQNFRGTVDEVVTALDLLTDGAITELSPDPGIRAAWLRDWTAGLAAVDTAIAAWFKQLESDPDRRFDAAALAAASGLTEARVTRLLLNDHVADVTGLAERTPHYDRFNPMRPIPLVRPLVLRAALGDEITVKLENRVRDRRVGLHLQGEGLGGSTKGGQLRRGVRHGDGAAVGANPDTTVGHGQSRRFRWRGLQEGVWPINDLADVRGSETGSNVHGLFGALIVEPAGATWRDPETGDLLTGTAFADGPHVDVILAGEDPADPRHEPFIDFHSDDVARSFREFAVFIHDEPEVHSGQHLVGEHTVMPLSYRAEPMANRLPHRMRRYAERTTPLPPADQTDVDTSAVRIEIDDELSEVFWTARTPEGEFLERVSGEEQHHSSWLFGEPVTPIFRNYRGDPARVRLVHAGIKETHVFHLHVHQWRAVPQDTARPSEWRPGEPRGSQLLDSITIGPQTGVTIDPLYGSGSRQHLFGDVIWHCHLYPHFHHGMWGLWRSFDRAVDGTTAYPDGTPSHRLVPLPGRPVEAPTPQSPGFPWLLRLPKHSARELAAFPPGVRANPQSGALFVDLDGDALRWNAEAGLPPPRIVSYDVDVAEDPVTYNARGWHDPHGHHYRITGIEVRQLDAAGQVAGVVRYDPHGHEIEPFFPRANHGDIVELRLHNRLGTIPADDFDLTTLPVECGLHVHLVKFDVLAADGSSTGWNYLSGASCAEAVLPDEVGQPPGNVGLHRWVVDEEFGPCFFHDHLLANYRQKHGLFAALIAEPHGSQWHRPDQETRAWSGPEAVVVPPVASGIAPFREACLAIGDFVPLYDQAKALNPPGELSGDDDPGSMAVNFRCSPLTFRGPDPSAWFETSDTAPDTPVIRTYPGERLRIRLVQGSHEEQHSFSMHGLRWRKEWHNPRSPLVSQQTIGISEAFTLELGVPVHGPALGPGPHDPAGGGPDDPHSSRYGPGDHLWHFAAMDDLWLGCWGLVRALRPTPANLAEFAPLPDLWNPPAAALRRLLDARATPQRPHRLPDDSWSAPVREHVVVARRREHHYDGTHLTDPWGLVFARAEGITFTDGEDGDPADGDPGDGGADGGDSVVAQVTGAEPGYEPLVLRARRGEWVRVVLVNEVLPAPGTVTSPLVQPFGVEPSPPPLPLEEVDELGYPVGRTVSPRVSLHPSLLRYDVIADDGANIGDNLDGTVAPAAGDDEAHGGHTESTVVFRDHHGLGHLDQNWREYWWYADEALAPEHHADGPGQVCYLQDMADVRNHRHHGLIGALVVEPGDVTPVDPISGEERWWGVTARLQDEDGDQVAVEHVLLLQDGLRLFVAGNPDLPMRDIVPRDDPEDAGQRAINYRTALVHPQVQLRDASPPTPLLRNQIGDRIWLRVVCAADKPRNHTFTLHGFAWPAAPWVPAGPQLGALSGLTSGTVHDLELRARHRGDHAYRSGAFRWAVEQGMWGILRVTD